jgi:hypothetical protein
MSCGGFNKRLAFGSLWGSSGGTRSSVHYDAYESVMCLFSGSKKFILFPPTYPCLSLASLVRPCMHA